MARQTAPEVKVRPQPERSLLPIRRSMAVAVAVVVVLIMRPSTTRLEEPEATAAAAQALTAVQVLREWLGPTASAAVVVVVPRTLVSKVSPGVQEAVAPSSSDSR